MSGFDETTPDAADENLVAYLDGELDAETAQGVERRLAADPDYRRRLHHLQKAWDLLDELPHPELSPQFTQSTISMVAAKADDQLAVDTSSRRSRRLWTWSLAAIGCLAAGMLGFGVVDANLTRPNRELRRDLPVIENLDIYRAADNLEFVRELAEVGLFDEEVHSNAP